ncbi:MAG: peptide ABC transporter substrate-binding protein [Firmicutes bacterium]|nr:peptide ABC transporter substrate-binding protein [Bacillota bacterium]
MQKAKTRYWPRMIILILILGVFIRAPLNLSTAEQGKSIAINLATHPLTLDPQVALFDTEKILLANLHEGLVVCDQGVLLPGAAAKWVLSSDGRTYTFHLKEAYWSNGDQVTAYDFELSWKRLLTTENPSRMLLDVVKNAALYRAGKLSNLDEIGIYALDERVLQVVLEEPCSYFLNLLTFPAFLPVHTKYIKENNFDYAPGFCSNGPFRLDKWEPRNHAVLVANDHYQGERGNLKEIKVTFFPTNTAVTLYAAGMIDLLEEPPFSIFPAYAADLVQASTMGTGFVYVNTRRPPLDKIAFRKALSLAINRDILVAKTLGFRGIPATGLIPPGISDSKSGTDFRRTGGDLIGPADGVKCLEQLYNAGYPSEDGYPELEILVVDSTVPAEMAKILAEMWELNLGIKVKVKAVSFDQFMELASTGRFYLARQGWEGDYPDPMTFLRLFHSQAAENFSGYQDQEYDDWLMEAERRMDVSSRYQIYHWLEEKLMTDLPVIPLYFSVKPYLVSSKLENVTYSPQGFPLFRTARKLD